VTFELSSFVHKQFRRHAEDEYPSEACGAVFFDGSTQVYEPLENLQDKYHKLDPKLYPRTSKEAFFINTLKFSRLIEDYESKGGQLFAIFHSHIDVGAYFSTEDRQKMASEDKKSEVFCSKCYIVSNISDGKAKEDAVFFFNPAKQDFEEGNLRLL
jgi:[CysO sulfur-carrier protein]-S-L-cysteine hydrolase